MKILNKGLLGAAFGNLFQICTVWIIFLVFAKVKPQAIVDSIGFGAVQKAAEAASIASNGGGLFEVPFAGDYSKTAAGVGEAMHRRDIDSSEEDRRKRSLESTYLNIVPIETLNEMESLLPVPHYHDRSKRAACHGLGGGGTGTGTGGGTTGGDEDLDLVERRRKAALKRKAAQRKKSKTTKKTTRKTNNPIVPEHEDEQNLRRRKRQTEVDDLNAGTNKSNKDFSEHARQVAEKVRQVWENIVTTMSEMAQQVKQKFSGGANQGNQMGEEV